MGDSYYTIGALAKAGGVRRSTIRYYEREGLMAPAKRTVSNYRQYDEDGLERLRFIRAAQASGFPLDDIRQLIEMAGQREQPNRRVQAMIEKRVTEIDERLEALQRVRESLQATLSACRSGEPEGCCPVVEKGFASVSADEA